MILDYQKPLPKFDGELKFCILEIIKEYFFVNKLNSNLKSKI